MTRSKAKARGLASTPSPSAGTPDVAFVDLGTNDAMTPLAQVAPVTVPPTPMDLPTDKAVATTPNVHSTIPVDEAAATAPDVHSTTPEGRGNMKLQFCIDRKVALLEERLHVYEVLD